MPTTLKSAVQKYLRSANPARGTRAEYNTTLTKWQEWEAAYRSSGSAERKSASFSVGSTIARWLEEGLAVVPRDRSHDTAKSN